MPNGILTMSLPLSIGRQSLDGDVILLRAYDFEKSILDITARRYLVINKETLDPLKEDDQVLYAD